MPSNKEDFAILKDRQGRSVALKGVNVRVHLRGLLAEVDVEQSYENPQTTNIEAIYTFPLPIGAVLLGLEVEIAGKKLSGKVVERNEAERSYEDAITDGDSTVMLQEAGPGLYTASIGNLMANESALIRYRYGLMLSWQGPRIRFLLPTTIAPRYGDAALGGLQPHQVSKSVLDAEYPLGLLITVEGELAAATISSPSHPITMERTGKGIAVRLAKNAVLDRDFVLNLESESAQSACIQTQDSEGFVAAASLRVPLVQDAVEMPISLRIVIDCSGSMAGTSIAQARKASLEILNLLRPKDRFNFTLFGSTCQHVFRKSVLASAKNITKAWNRLNELAADMGGTEMEKALKSTFTLSTSNDQSCVLLITDGEIHEHERVIQLAKTSNHRVFTVGVGNAVSEVFLKSLATATGGACELVAPQEGMSERILSQFHRFRQPQLEAFHIVWPTEPVWTTALPDSAFAGDTIHVFAGFDQPLTGEIILHASVGGSAYDAYAHIASCEEKELPRIAAANRIQTSTETQGLQLSLDYQLLSRWTSYLVIAEREIKAGDLPELHQVPQMLAAGWGGVGKTKRLVASGCSAAKRPGVCYSFEDDFSLAIEPKHQSANASLVESPGQSERETTDSTPEKFIAQMELRVANSQLAIKLPDTIGELKSLGLDKDWATFMLRLVNEGHDERQVVAAFVYALSESPIGHLFSRAPKRIILKGWKDAAPEATLDSLMFGELKGIDASRWGFSVGIQAEACKPNPLSSIAETIFPLKQLENMSSNSIESRATKARQIWAFVAFNGYSLCLMEAVLENTPRLFDVQKGHYIWRLFAAVVVTAIAAFLAGAVVQRNGAKMGVIANIPSVIVWCAFLYANVFGILVSEGRTGSFIISVIAIPLTTWIAYQFCKYGAETQTSEFRSNTVLGIRPIHWFWIIVPLYIYAYEIVFVAAKFFVLQFFTGHEQSMKSTLVAFLTLLPIFALIAPIIMTYKVLAGSVLSATHPVIKGLANTGILIGGVLLAFGIQLACSWGLQQLT